MYYHLVHPFYTFAQIRRHCHDRTIVVFEGDVTSGLRAQIAQIDLSDRAFGIFVPKVSALNGLLKAAYLRVTSQTFMGTPRLDGWFDRLRYTVKTALGRRGNLPPKMNRAVTVCTPFTGTNCLHMYRPPFGLAAYDDRFASAAAPP